LALFGAALTLGWSGVTWAQSAPSPDLQNEVQELQQEVQELKGEIGTLKSQQTVKAPAAPAAGTAAAAAPQTVGEHLGQLEKDVSDIRTNLATNLGVHIHGLVDVPYEYNLNEPLSSSFSPPPPGNKGGPNPTATGPGTNQYRAFDTEINGWDLQQFNLHLDRTSDGGVGFVTELNFGEVANVLRASTRNSNINPGATSNDVIDLTQAYLTYTAPLGSGINLEAGRFATLLGAEVIPTYQTYGSADYNISRSLVFTLGEPLTHTGLRAAYTINNYFNVISGINNGWDDVTNSNDGQTVEAEFNFSTADLLSHNQSLALAFNGIYGPEQVNRGSSKLWALDPVLTYHSPIKGLQFIGEYLYAQESGPVTTTPGYSTQGNQFCTTPVSTPTATNPGGFPFCTPPPGSAFTPAPGGTIQIPYQTSWTGAAGYIVLDVNDNLELVTRGEWFDDPNGVRTGLRQTLGEITGTINYKVPLVTGLLGRLEYRHDQSSAKPFFDNEPLGPQPAPSLLAGFPAHTRSGQDTFMADAVYTF
jgi:hypothetical protein